MNNNNQKSSKYRYIKLAIMIVIIVVSLIKGSGYLDNDGSSSGSSQRDAVSNFDSESVLGFRNENLLSEHYEKHGIEMGFSSESDYENAAKAVVVNEDALHKLEADDGDDIYYLESTNEFVIVSKDGYIRTYFYPSDGKAYYDRQ